MMGVCRVLTDELLLIRYKLLLNYHLKAKSVVSICEQEESTRSMKLYIAFACPVPTINFS